MLKVASRHPRVLRRLGVDINRLSYKPSRFANVEQLVSGAGSTVAADTLLALERNGKLSAGASKLLFHWTSWLELHSIGQSLYRPDASM